jgi:hypothetical protein
LLLLCFDGILTRFFFCKFQVHGQEAPK